MIEDLLSRLDHVRKVGPGKWRACCPAHGGKNRQALSILEKDDGSVLLHCFSGECEVSDIVEAVGLELHDLFPPRVEGNFKKGNGHKDATDKLAAALYGITVAAITLADINGRGRATKDERQRLIEIAASLGRMVP